jgi:hypothetical protein
VAALIATKVKFFDAEIGLQRLATAATFNGMGHRARYYLVWLLTHATFLFFPDFFCF